MLSVSANMASFARFSQRSQMIQFFVQSRHALKCSGLGQHQQPFFPLFRLIRGMAWVSGFHVLDRSL